MDKLYMLLIKNILEVIDRIGLLRYVYINRFGQWHCEVSISEKFISLSLEKQNIIINAALLSFGTNGYQKRPARSASCQPCGFLLREAS